MPVVVPSAVGAWLWRGKHARSLRGRLGRPSSPQGGNAGLHRARKAAARVEDGLMMMMMLLLMLMLMWMLLVRRRGRVCVKLRRLLVLSAESRHSAAVRSSSARHGRRRH